MTNREALAAIAEGKVVRSPGCEPIFCHPTKGFMFREPSGEWTEFAAYMDDESYELALSVPAPVVP